VWAIYEGRLSGRPPEFSLALEVLWGEVFELIQASRKLIEVGGPIASTPTRDRMSASTMHVGTSERGIKRRWEDKRGENQGPPRGRWGVQEFQRPTLKPNTPSAKTDNKSTPAQSTPTTKDSKTFPKSEKKYSTDKKCFACGEHGHMMRDCPKKKQLNHLMVTSSGSDGGAIRMGQLQGGPSVKGLLDTGAMGHSFCNKRVRDAIAEQDLTKVQPADHRVMLGVHRQVCHCTEVETVTVQLSLRHLGTRNREVTVDLLVLPNQRFDIVVGWGNITRLNLVQEVVGLAPP